jgi:hypothetical protein
MVTSARLGNEQADTANASNQYVTGYVIHDAAHFEFAQNETPRPQRPTRVKHEKSVDNAAMPYP